MSSYIPIASQTLGSSASSVTFSSIPTTLGGKTLRDLVLVADYLGAGNPCIMGIRFNSDTGSNYSYVRMEGTGSAANSAASTTDSFNPVDFVYASTTERAQHLYSIMDFAQTNKHKSILFRGNRAATGVNASAGRWANTAAIISITGIAIVSNFAAGSTFSLYGIEG